MNKHKNRLTFVTDILLIIIFIGVFSVSFFTEKITPISIYGKTEYQAYYYGNKNSDNVSLMFNVYENTEIVNNILEVLKAKGVTATFFVGGCWADDNAETLNKINFYGNEIANHGYFHKDHATLSYEKNREEIYNTDCIVKAVCGVKMNLFAPPSGSYSDTTLAVADALGYKTVMWSKDTIDWRDKEENKIIKRATEKVSGGDLILMHPKQHTLNVLDKIIDVIVAKGLKIVTVSENIGSQS